jgi:hypothetical protein
MKRKPLCSDYDGMGDFSRFPPAQKNSKKDLVVWNFFRIFVSNKLKRPS